MRILVTGAHGQLGRELVAMAPHMGHAVFGVDRAACDITSPSALRTTLAAVKPEVIVNCAAWTRVDDAEREADAAFRVNAMGPRNLAVASRAAGIRLCHVSTDFVFDGDASSPIDEWARPNPLGVYGASKLAGEEEVRGLCPDHLVVRTAWLYGQDGPNFVLTMMRLARERGSLRVVADQHGSPTWTGHLAGAVMRLIDLGAAGTFNLTNSGSTTWHGFAEAIVAGAGLTAVPVMPISTSDYPTAARRPIYSVLDNRAWRLMGEAALPHWEKGLEAYLARVGPRRRASEQGLAAPPR